MLSNVLDWIIFNKLKYKFQIFQKCFQNVQLFSTDPTKCLNVDADSWYANFIKKLLWSLTNGIQDVNEESWKITGIHWKFVYLVKITAQKMKFSIWGTLSPEHLENTNNFEGWGLSLVAYIKKNCVHYDNSENVLNVVWVKDFLNTFTAAMRTQSNI